MKSLRYERMLFYYDGPQVFELRDAIGGHYIAVKITPEQYSGTIHSQNGLDDSFLVAGVAPGMLSQFRSGGIDLRALLLGSDRNEHYLGIAENGIDDSLVLQPLDISLTESELLPDEGFLLHDSTSEGVLKEARERNNLVVELTAEPIEAAGQHRIRAMTLAGLLHHVQTLVRHSFRKAQLAYNSRDRGPNSALLDVVIPATPGSFRMILEAAESPDLFGSSCLEIAFSQVDALFEQSSSPEETLALMRENKGHFAGSYLKLLRFLAENHTSLFYSWAAPRSKSPTKRAILEKETRPLIQILTSVEKLATEEVALEGEFEKFNRRSGLWGLRAKDGYYTGAIGDEGPSLDGLEVGGSYRFHCDEEIEETIQAGKEKRTLYLRRHERIASVA